MLVLRHNEEFFRGRFLIMFFSFMLYFLVQEVSAQVNVLGKQGYLMTPASRWDNQKRDVVLGMAYIPEHFAINYFMKKPYRELMVHGDIEVFDFLRVGINLTYLPEIPQRVGVGDRHIDFSLRVWKEKKWRPSLMLILTPPAGLSDYLNHNAVVMSKTISWNSMDRFEFSIGFGMDKSLYQRKLNSQGRRFDLISRRQLGNRYLNGFFSGMKYNPSNWLSLMLEYDSSDFHAGANVIIWKRLSMQVAFYGFEKWGGMLHYRFPLEIKPRELRRYEKKL